MNKVLSFSFSEKAKYELAEAKLHSRHEKMSFLSGLIRAAGSLIISGGVYTLIIITVLDSVSALADNITSDVYNARSDIKKSLRRSEMVYSGEYINRLLTDCGIVGTSGGQRGIILGIEDKLVKTEDSAAAYIRGAFLGAGSVSLKQSYHMEFVFSSYTVAEDFCALLSGFNIIPKIAERADKFLVYLKDSQSISDCLALMGASRAVLELNNEIAKRQVAGYTNRFTNCEIYNLGKQVDAAVLQVKAINYLMKNNIELDEKLKQTCRVRMTNPEASLSEISVLLGISKSGLNHRLDKIVELYKNLSGKNQN